jgi:K+-sensing histidine kinase KdpD
LAFLVDGARLAPLADQKGLGLWMVTRLLEDIGGRIKVESRAGHGTTVAVRLPAPAAAGGDQGATGAVAATTR